MRYCCRPGFSTAVLAFVMSLAASSTWAADPATPKTGGAQGSFRPPVVSRSIDEPYLAGTGLLALAGPMTLYGVAAGAGGAAVADPNVPLGYEALVMAMRGGAANVIPVSAATTGGLGMSSLGLDLAMVSGSLTLKYKPIDMRKNGYAGLLLYGTGDIGFNQVALTNNYGTARTLALTSGGGGGALVEGRIGSLVEIEAFAGYRLLYFSPMRTGSMGSTTTTMPEFGGDVTVHLPYGLSASLSSLFNIMKQGEKNKQAKTFVLGLSWRPDDGLSPISEGGKS